MEDEGSSGSRSTEGRGKMMENDAAAAADASVPTDDAATAAAGANPEDLAAPGTSEGAESRRQGRSMPNMESANDDSCGSNSDASPACGDTDENGDTSPTLGDGQNSESKDQEERDELISSLDDQIVIPAKSKQTKAEIIDDDGIAVADKSLDGQSMQKNADSDGQSAGSNREKVKGGHPEKVNANEETLPGSVSSDANDLIEGTTIDNGEDSTNNAQDLNEVNNGSGSVSDGNNVEQEAASTSKEGEESGNAARKQDASDSIESAIDVKSNSSEPPKHQANGSSNEESDNDQSSEVSAHSKDQTGNKTANQKDSTDTNTTDSVTKKDDVKSDEGPDGPRKIVLVDYASKLAGAQILEQSASLKGASNLLTGDKDRYSIAPCEDKKYVIMGLSEDILVKQIKLSNYERYSSRVRKFQVLASQEYPTPNEEYWNTIGTYEAKSKSGEQEFELPEPAWARYLKFRFLSHYGSEHYCTLSQIKVHGSTMLQGFHEQWIESEKKDRELEGVVQEGGEAEPVEEEGEVLEEGNAGGDEQDEPQEEVNDGAQDSGESNEVAEEIPVVDKGPGKQGEEAPAALVDAQGAEAKKEAVTTESDANKETGNAKSNGEPQQDAVSDTAEIRGNEQGKATVQEEKSVSSNESSLEANADLQASGDSEEVVQNPPEETKEVQEDDAGGAKENDDVSNEVFASASGDFENQKDSSNAVEVPDNQGTVEVRESVTANEGAEPMRNDSSIAAVKDVVKAAVADASGAIGNAASDAIKNVKDAIRTRTVTGSKVDGTKMEDNATLSEGLPSDGDAEGEAKSNQQTVTAKQDEPSKKTSDQAGETTSPPPPSEDGSTMTTSQDVVKPKAGEGPAKIKGASMDKVTEARSKNVEVKTPEAKPQKGASDSNRDSKSTTAASRNMVQRGTITLAGKDGKDIDASTGELYAKLSHRFPHASCMKDLNFQAFKSKTLLANNAGSSGGPVGPGGGAKMEPIFTKITNEIKSVQITQSQYEQYISALKECYETVFWDVAKDLDSSQARVDQRLSSLERAVFLSEMRSKGHTSPSFDRVSELFSSIPFAVSALQFSDIPSTMPECSPALCAGLAAFLLMLLWCLPRRKKPRGGINDEAKGNSQIRAAAMSGPSLSRKVNARNNDSGHSNESAAQTPKLASANVLPKKENDELTTKLASSNETLGELQTEHTTLLQEHVSLQRRYSQLEQRFSTLENQVKMGQMTANHGDEYSHKSKSEINHVVFNGEVICSTPTPSVQSIQSEPVSSETFTTPTKQGKKIVSPLKKGFRKKKSGAKR